MKEAGMYRVKFLLNSECFLDRKTHRRRRRIHPLKLNISNGCVFHVLAKGSFQFIFMESCRRRRPRLQ